MKPLTIGHLAREAGINLATVRYYEREGLLPKPPRSVWAPTISGGRRTAPAVHQACSGTGLFTQRDSGAPGIAGFCTNDPRRHPKAG